MKLSSIAVLVCVASAATPRHVFAQEVRICVTTVGPLYLAPSCDGLGAGYRDGGRFINASVLAEVLRDELRRSNDQSLSQLKTIADAFTREADAIIRRLDSVEKRTTQYQIEVKSSLDSLPARVLTSEAKKALEEAVIADLRSDLSKLRNDLQRQIDDLKKP